MDVSKIPQSKLNKLKIATCGGCKKDLPPTVPRIFHDGEWWCSDCEYFNELGITPGKIDKPPTPRTRKQKETLFDG